MSDRFFLTYIGELQLALKNLSDDLLVANLDSLYHAGKLQGKAEGIRFALDVLTNKLEEMDK
jgi:hypothetical protein